MALIVAAAGGAVLLFVISVVALLRSRRAEEWERFHQVSELTSGWSRQATASMAPAALSTSDQERAPTP